MVYGQEQARYRPVNQRQAAPVLGAYPTGPMGPDVIGEPPNPTGMVGAPATGGMATGGGRAGRTATGDLPGAPPMPGGQQPANANGFRRFQPANGMGGMGSTGRAPGATRPGVGAVAPRPAAPPAPVVPPPPPALPPAPIVEPPNPTTGILPREQAEAEGTLTDQTFLPGGDPRLTGAQDRTDAAMKRIGSGGSYSTRAVGGEERYRKLFGSGAVSANGIDTDVAFDAVDPSAKFRAIKTAIEGGPDVAGVDAGRYVKEQDAAVAGLGGPSRTELAAKAAADLRSQGAKDLENRFRKVGQSAAKFGRIGMGDVNAELGSIQGDYERDLLTKENDLARSVAEGDISDRFRRVDATSGLRRGESEIGAGLRGEQRLERGYDDDIALGNIGRSIGERDAELGLTERTIGRRMSERDSALGAGERAVGRRMSERDTMMGLDERNQDRAFDRQRNAIDLGGRDASQDIGNEYDQLNAAGQLEDRIFGQGQQNRGEYRTERGYQQGRRQMDLDSRIRQRELENSEQQQRISRAIALMQAGGRVPNLDDLLRAG